jgi:hypothetical protein
MPTKVRSQHPNEGVCVFEWLKTDVLSCTFAIFRVFDTRSHLSRESHEQALLLIHRSTNDHHIDINPSIIIFMVK